MTASFMCFVDLGIAFNRVPRPVIEWAIHTKMVPGSLVRAVMTLRYTDQSEIQKWVLMLESPCWSRCISRICLVSTVCYYDLCLIRISKERYLWNMFYADDLILKAKSMRHLESWVYLLSAHVVPAYPGRQVHSNPLTKSVQTAPFRQGFGTHSSISTIQSKANQTRIDDNHSR